MDKQVPISEAKNSLAALVHIIEHGPAVQLTRHGKPVAVLVSISQYKRLACRPKSFWAALNAFRESIDTNTLLTCNDHFIVLHELYFGFCGWANSSNRSCKQFNFSNKKYN